MPAGLREGEQRGSVEPVEEGLEELRREREERHGGGEAGVGIGWRLGGWEVGGLEVSVYMCRSTVYCMW